MVYCGVCGSSRLLTFYAKGFGIGDRMKLQITHCHYCGEKTEKWVRT